MTAIIKPPIQAGGNLVKTGSTISDGPGLATDVEIAAAVAAHAATPHGTSPPSGGAGGVLSGTYPNPGFAVDMAEQSELDLEIINRAADVDTEEARAIAQENLKLAKASNLSDLANASTARTNLGLGTAAVENVGAFDAAGTAAAAVAALVDSSPATLDTLNELAAALGDDPNFATTLTNALALKAPLASPTFTGTVTLPGDPGSALVAAPKQYVDAADALHQAATASVHGLSALETVAGELFVKSRGQNLVTNGYGQLRTNRGFPGTTFDPIRLPAGFGSFRTPSGPLAISGDEQIAVDPLQMYVFELYAKADAAATGAYFGLVPLDLDGNQIFPYHWDFDAATVTTLAADLVAGNTVVSLTSSAGWAVSAIKYLAVFPHTSAGGFVFPTPPAAGSYTRRVSATSGGGAISAVGAGTVTLDAAWTGSTIPAGTTVAETEAGLTYAYAAGAGVSVSTSWTKYSGHIGRLTTPTLGPVANRFFPATAFVSLVFLINLAGGATPEHNLGGVSFGRHLNALQSPDGTWRELVADNAGVLTAPALA